MAAHTLPQKTSESLSNPSCGQQGFPFQLVHNIATTDLNDLESLLSAASYPDCPPPRRHSRSLGQAPVPTFQSGDTSPLTEWHATVSTKPREETSGIGLRSRLKQTKRQSVASSSQDDENAAVKATEERKKEVSTILLGLNLSCAICLTKYWNFAIETAKTGSISTTRIPRQADIYCLISIHAHYSIRICTE